MRLWSSVPLFINNNKKVIRSPFISTLHYVLLVMIYFKYKKENAAVTKKYFHIVTIVIFISNNRNQSIVVYCRKWTSSNVRHFGPQLDFHRSTLDLAGGCATYTIVAESWSPLKKSFSVSFVNSPIDLTVLQWMHKIEISVYV